MLNRPMFISKWMFTKKWDGKIWPGACKKGKRLVGKVHICHLNASTMFHLEGSANIAFVDFSLKKEFYVTPQLWVSL